MNKKIAVWGALLFSCSSPPVRENPLIKEEIRAEEETGYEFPQQIENREGIINCVYQTETEHRYRVLGTGFHYSLPALEGSATAISLEENIAYLLTNNHVIAPFSAGEVLADEMAAIREEMIFSGIRPPRRISLKYIDSEITIYLNEEEIVVENLEHWRNEREDLALLRAELTDEETEQFRICSPQGDDLALERGQTLLAVGFQIEENLLTQGIYSGSFSGFMGSSRILVSDHDVIPGFSGGAVFAVRRGIAELVGIERCKWMDYGLIVPISVIRNWLEEIEMNQILPEP